MEKVQITLVKVDDKDKNGNPLISSKSGKPYFKVGIKTNEYGDTWINGLMPFNPDKWQGTTQDLEIYDEEYNGKMYKKFKLPPRENRGGGMSADQWALINRKLDAIYTEVQVLKGRIPDLEAEDLKTAFD